VGIRVDLLKIKLIKIAPFLYHPFSSIVVMVITYHHHHHHHHLIILLWESLMDTANLDTATILPKQLANRLEELHQSAPHNASSSTTTTTTTSIQNALIQSFLQVDATLPKPIRESGCTASLLLRLDNIIYVANTGDSQSYIASYHRNTK